MTQTRAPKSKRGFASMDPELRRAIASQGGKTAHARKLAHEFTPEEARRAAAARRRKRQEALAAQQQQAQGGQAQPVAPAAGVASTETGPRAESPETGVTTPVSPISGEGRTEETRTPAPAAGVPEAQERDEAEERLRNAS